MNDLPTQYDAWLAEHLTPSRTASGGISMRRGVVQYEADDRMRKLLGGVPMALTDPLRRGDDVALVVRQAVEVLVELWDVGRVLRYRRDEALARHLASGIKLRADHGVAPDGGRLDEWARRVRRRLDRTYGVAAALEGRAAELWAEVCGVPANNLRRRRRAS